ncbi:MAG: shikimate dehydrogenase [Candidatus Methylomirabilales bacterium]
MKDQIEINGETRIVGIIGDPVSHSLSPCMHNAAFAAKALDAVYIPWPVAVEDFPTALQAVRRMENFSGGNVTVPHKEHAAKLCDGLSPEAEALGAVNTLVAQDGRLFGHNTDGAGFLRSLEEGGFDPKGKRVLLLGAGGAAKAVAFALAGAGTAELTIANRTLERAEALAALLRGRSPGCQILALSLHNKPLAPAIASADLVVNATTLGLKPEDPSPIDWGPLNSRALAVDLIYNPTETAFLKGASRRGLKVQNGLGMLLYQGAAAFELWTKEAAPLGAMRAALRAAFSRKL